MNSVELWDRFKEYHCRCDSIGLSLDISRMNFSDDFFSRMEPLMRQAYDFMSSLESGAVANPDENRMVGHYWLRNPFLAPSPEIRKEILDTHRAIKDFVFSVHAGKIKPRKRSRFTNLLSVGIGGSALGPQFVSDALGNAGDVMKTYFIDNTDPDGIDRLLNDIGPHLDNTLTIIISKSGGTVETRNGMLEIAAAYKKQGLVFERHAVAVTGKDSRLDLLAARNGWLTSFPMWDWVGGRTSVTSAVGLLPMALQGLDIDGFLSGAARCDEITRNRATPSNPSALLALMWHHAGSGKGARDMVILPYKDRLQMFARYLQQLVMESLGKALDLTGKKVHQGLSVYGNKGSTDQHAYIQQLRDGLNNFFVTFVEVLQDRAGRSLFIEPDTTSGDYLSSFLLGTRNALYENNRESITITLDRIDAPSIGALIALYERAVGYYASLVNINAYHQPGVEAGKKMATAIIALKNDVLTFLKQSAGNSFTAEEIARSLGKSDEAETVFKILEHHSRNVDCGVKVISGPHGYDSRYGLDS